MEKIIISEMGNITQFDNDSNMLLRADSPYFSLVRDVCRVRKDGLVITKDEVIDVKAGDIVLSCNFYSCKLSEYISKVLVISDATVAYDLEQIERMKEEHKKKDKE